MKYFNYYFKLLFYEMSENAGNVPFTQSVRP